MISDKKNIKLGVVISYLTLIINVIGNIVVTRQILYYVGDAQYGLLSFVNSITTWLTVISNALGASFIRFATIEKEETGEEKETKRLYNRLFLFIALAAIVIGAIILGSLYIGNVDLFGYPHEESNALYLLFAFSIIQLSITIAFSVYSLYINYKKKYIFARSLTLGINILTFAANWIIAFTTKNIVFVALFGTVQVSLSVIIQIVYVKKILNTGGFYSKDKINKSLFRQIVIFSGILLFGTVVSQISNQVDKTILGSMGLPEDVAIYQLGQSFSNYIIILSSSVATVYIPTINELVVKKKDEELNELFLRVSRFQIIVITTVVFGFLACGRDFVILWLDESRITVFYISAAWFLVLLCSETSNMSLEIQRARNKHLFRCVTFLSLALSNIGLSILLIYIMGKERAVYACLLGSVITSFASNWIALSIYNAKKMKLPMLKYFSMLGLHVLAGALAFGMVFGLFYLPGLKDIDNTLVLFLLKGVIFVLIYGAFIFFYDGKFIKYDILEKRKLAKEGEQETSKEESHEE